jgi:hypothetical protein
LIGDFEQDIAMAWQADLAATSQILAGQFRFGVEA